MSDNPKTVAEVLDAAADLIEPEGAWTQGVGARDQNGSAVGSLTSSATCWCTITATQKVARRDVADLTFKARNFLRSQLGTHDLGAWNDAPERTQAEVVAKLREAAQIAREQGL